MSITKHIIIGSLGNWGGIMIGFAERLIIFPFMLSHWSASEFGNYLALNAIISFISIPGKSYETIIGRECLRIGYNDKSILIGLFGGGIIISLISEFVIALLVLSSFLLIDRYFDYLHYNTHVFILVIVSFFISRVLINFPGALYVQILSCFGYYHKFVWLGLISKIIALSITIIFVISGGSEWMTICVGLVAPAIFAPFSWLLSSKWGKREGVWIWKPNIKEAFRVWFLSLQNLFVEGVTMLRTDGTRLILAPLAGAQSMAAFVTMRTGANMALQGLTTITNPIMPELMKYLAKKDQDRCESIFATVWIVLIALMAPSVVILQAVIEPLYIKWTVGKMHFNPGLFALLSLSVLVFALSQPSMAIISGNNLLKAQLYRAILESFIVIGGMWLLVPVLGILGGGIALLLAEIVTAISYRIAAQRWLDQNQLVWPSASFYMAALSVLISSLSMFLMVLYPNAKLIVLSFTSILFVVNNLMYWRTLPTIVTNKIKLSLHSFVVKIKRISNFNI